MWRQVMAAIPVVLAVQLSGLASADTAAPATPAAPSPGCHFGEIIDGSTMRDAKSKIEAAGFVDVHALKKSCDNFWHGEALLNGAAVNVVLSPAGVVMLESD